MTTEDKRKCGLDGNWCYVHHCYPSTCEQMKFGEYGESTPPKSTHIDTTGQELANKFCDGMIQNLRRNVPASIATTQGDAEPCIDCCEPGSTKETIEEQKIPYGQTGVVLTAYVPVFTCTKCDMQWTDWRGEGIREKVVAAYLAQPKPAPQAEAQESLPEEPKMLNGNEEITWDMLWIDRKKWIDYARKVVDAWNAQQAKIEALEQQIQPVEKSVSDEHLALVNFYSGLHGANFPGFGTPDDESKMARELQQYRQRAESRIAELEEKLREGK